MLLGGKPSGFLHAVADDRLTVNEALAGLQHPVGFHGAEGEWEELAVAHAVRLQCDLVARQRQRRQALANATSPDMDWRDTVGGSMAMSCNAVLSNGMELCVGLRWLAAPIPKLCSDRAGDARNT